MERTRRCRPAVAALSLAAVLAAAVPSAAQLVQPSSASVKVPPALVTQGPPKTSERGLGPQKPALSPLSVRQLEEGRQSVATDQPFSLSFAEPISVRELLLVLVRDTNLSVVPAPDVDGTFSGELKNVTLRQALDLILPPLHLDYQLAGTVLTVAKRKMETQIFPINYVASRRTGSRASGSGGVMGAGGYSAGMTGATGTMAGGGYGAYGSGMMGSGMGAGGFGGSQASVASTDSGDLFDEIAAGVKTLVSADGKHNVDRKAGLLQVTDFRDRLNLIGQYLEAVETRVLRQVQIQAKVLEVELRDEFSAGIDWSAVLRSAGNAVTVTQRLAPASSGGAFTVGLDLHDFQGLLDAFASQGHVNVMASPRVMAMNNEPAVMRVGTQDVFFVTTSQIDSTTGQVLQTTVTPQAITEGIVLSVTPQIAADGIVHLSITPSITERTGTATSRLGDQVPIVAVRETDTMVRVHQGETIVIAGLMQERGVVEKSKVPVLGDVPLVGGLFQRNQTSTRKTDLVILLTPTVMAPQDVAADTATHLDRLFDAQRVPVRK